MSFTGIKTKNQGFTIVELLIVVVVIAILAAITIVSYNGITNRANASAAKSLAATWQKKAELYYAENSDYPVTQAELSGDSTKSWYLPTAGVVGTPTSGTRKTVLAVQTCGSGAGFTITHWDYEAGNLPGTPQVRLGTTTSCVTLP